jgi:hypothetical protein
MPKPEFPQRIHTVENGTKVNEGVFISWEEHEALSLAMRDQALAHLWEEINAWKPTLHFCRDWDFLLIENGDPEFEACGCGPFPLKYATGESAQARKGEEA